MYFSLICMKYSADELRKQWFIFWESKHHKIIPSASVLPDNDPTALFHNAGMHPLVPFLMGQKHPEGVRLANVQKCIRTGDIDEVGDATHLTFFEMLGNWSLGDYFKKEQIEWSFEFLTDVLQLPLEKLAVSVFAGTEHIPRDTESARYWKECGIMQERIAYLGMKDNWWAKGDIGPCGPDTEMFYWTGDTPAPLHFQDTHDDPRWVEIWNDVFMQFHKDQSGILHPLPQKNIDTGMGLERAITVLNGYQSVYQTEIFTDILSRISDIAKKPEIKENPIAQTSTGHSARIIADHIRSSSILIADGIFPSNVDQGYILRRLIRRAVRHGRKIGIHENFCARVAEQVIENLMHTYTELHREKKSILHALEQEENLFRTTLEKGEKEFEKLMIKHDGRIDGKMAFYIYETYGFPFEMTQELAQEHNIQIEKSEFDICMKEHQEKSKSNAEKKFKGGLGDHSEETTKLHTATHLMHTALRKVLGDHVEQKGSNITPERLRFDFSHSEKMTPEQIKAVEELVNTAIDSDEEVHCAEMTLEEAQKQNAIGLFQDRYADRVSVYTMGEFSKEICGGPHVKRLGELGHFQITKEQSAAQGIRRIKAVLTPQSK